MSRSPTVDALGRTAEVVQYYELGYDPVAANMLQRVKGKGSTGPVVYEGAVTWKATDTAVGPATLRIHPEPSGATVEAWGPGAQVASDRVPDLLGASDDPAGLQPGDPIVADLMRRRRFDRMTRTNAIWEHIVPTVLGQKVPTAAARDSWQAMLRRWGRKPPGPAPAKLRLVPSPEVLGSVGYHEFHPLNVERKRAQTIIAAARRANRLEEALEMPPAKARARLEAFPGIGPWTSSIVVQLGLGDPDSVVVGDYNLPGQVAWVLAGERDADDARMLELLEPYQGQRARVQNLVKYAGSKRPRHGAKLDVIDLTDR
ncbi:MAG: hypothetical protein KDB16_04725 [Acidimicrobiales bacterium]|nr:hypothetical protein [Acidimicrobiales bacterium]